MKRKRTPFVILGFLADRPMTGYEIKREIESSVAHFWSESYGQLYPVLGELKAQKLATAKIERMGARQRQVFSITPKGRKALSAWLAGPTEAGVVRQELILKLFFLGNTDPAVLIPQIEAYRSRAESALQYYDEVESEWSERIATDRHARFRLMTLRAGQQLSRTRLKWAEATLAELGRLAESAARAS